MPWIHRSAHSDGRSSKRFKTETAALASVAKSMGRDHDYGEPLQANRRYVDDNGGTHIVEEVSSSVRSAATDEALGRAYDARECGTATKRQLALLDRHGM